MTSQSFATGRGTGRRRSHHPRVGAVPATVLPASSGPAAAATAARFPVQSSRFTPPNYPFQPLPQPNGPSPYRYDLSQLLAPEDIQAIVAGAGGYTNLGTIHTIDGEYPAMPLELGDELTLEQYDQTDFGFLRLEFSKERISGSYIAAPYTTTATPAGTVIESFTIDLATKTVATV